MIEEHEGHFRDTESDYFSFFKYYLQACDLKKTPRVYLPHAKIMFYCYGMRF